MMISNDYPILEYDDEPVARLNPTNFASEPFSADRMVITFFQEVIDRLITENRIEIEREISGENPLTVFRYQDMPEVLVTLGQVGCPACAGNLDLFNAMGIKNVMFCGGGGVLDRTIQVGQLLLVEGAIRDEGFSYHYLPASRVIYTAPETTQTIAGYLDQAAIPYLRGLTWTTDAIFRETPVRIARRKAEGAKIVEMEQSGCIAVAQFRGFSYGALIYGGDDVSQGEWNQRSWRSRKGIRYDLVELCKTLVSII